MRDRNDRDGKPIENKGLERANDPALQFFRYVMKIVD